MVWARSFALRFSYAAKTFRLSKVSHCHILEPYFWRLRRKATSWIRSSNLCCRAHVSSWAFHTIPTQVWEELGEGDDFSLFTVRPSPSKKVTVFQTWSTNSSASWFHNTPVCWSLRSGSGLWFAPSEERKAKGPIPTRIVGVEKSEAFPNMTMTMPGTCGGCPGLARGDKYLLNRDLPFRPVSAGTFSTWSDSSSWTKEPPGTRSTERRTESVLSLLDASGLRRCLRGSERGGPLPRKPPPSTSNNLCSWFCISFDCSCNLGVFNQGAAFFHFQW